MKQNRFNKIDLSILPLCGNGWSMTCLWVPRFFFLLSLVYGWTPLINFSVQLLCSFASWLLFSTFKYFLSLIKFLLCSCTVLLTLVSIFMTCYFDIYLSGKSYNSVSLWSVSVNLSSSFVRSTFAWFFIYLDSLCWRPTLARAGTSPSLHGLVL